MVPLGYESRDRKLVIHAEEAERVRGIFAHYLELGSIGPLLADLRGRGIVTKVRRLANGRTRGGIPFTRGPLAYLLRNRFYIGEVVYKRQICPGEQPPILDRDLFEAVQAKLSEQRTSHHEPQLQARAQVPLLRLRQPELAGSVIRVPAAEVESLICNAVAQHANEPAVDVRELVSNHVARVDITATSIEVTVNPAPKSAPHHKLNSALRDQDGEHDARDVGSVETDDQHDNANQAVLSIPWTKRSAKRHREIMIPTGASRSDIRPIRAETRAKLVSAIARGRLWLSEIESGAVSSVEDIAARENCSKRHVNMTISLAFLAPSLVKAAVEGSLPHGMGIARMFDLPSGWARQYEILGLVPPA
jgi:site-specific DNA recombinase